MMPGLALRSLLFIISVTAAANDVLPPVVMGGRYRHHRQPGTESGSKQLQVFCFRGLPRRVYFLWHTVFFNISAIPSDLEVFIGNNETTVRQKYRESRQYFFSYWWRVAVWKTGSIPLTPFSASCVGVSSSKRYEVTLEWKIDYWRIPLCVMSIILFWNAPRLSRHMALYYSCGMSISVLASILVVVYVLHRFLPFRRGLYALMFFSSATTLAILDYVVRNLETILVEYQTFAITYVALMSGLSFCVLYYFAPRMNPRTYNLVQWGLQAASFLGIFYSSQIPEVASAIAALLLLAYNFPKSLFTRVRCYWYRWFPKKRRYLTEEEYRTTIREATDRALSDLRDYCRSPECRSWMLVSKLKAPSRFASFVEGESHLLEEEEEAYTDWETSSGAERQLIMRDRVGQTGTLGRTGDEADVTSDSDESIDAGGGPSGASLRR